MNSTNNSYGDIRGVGSIARVLIGLTVALNVIGYICALVIKEHFSSGHFSDTSATSALVHIISSLAEIGAVFVGLAALIYLVVWMGGALRNLPTFNALGTKYKDWYCWSCFIPILNLFLPMLILQEIWKGSDPSNLDSSGWKKCPASKLIYAAWISVLASLLGTAVLSYGLLIETVAVFRIVACVLLILVIGQISIRQEAKRVQVERKTS